MVRRIIAAKPSFENVQQIQSTLHRVGTHFEAKNDPQKTLADEIEVGYKHKRIDDLQNHASTKQFPFCRHARN
jgi:hypothetical protein